MTATATQSPPTRRCARCEAPMAPEQDWCLECGTESDARITRSPSWILPAAIILVVLAAVAGAVFLVAGGLNDDAEKAAGPKASAASAASTPARPTAGARAKTGPNAGAAGTKTAAAKPKPASTAVPLWPRDRTAYTVVVAAPASRAIAVKRARSLRKLGRDAGILRSDDYDLFGPGLWVVWRGRYPTRGAAERAESEVKLVVPQAYATFIRRKRT